MNPVLKDILIGISVPVGIGIVVFGTHYLLLWRSWKKELMRDEKKRKLFDRLLSDDPGCENEEVLHPQHWSGFRNDSEMKIV